MCLFTFCQELTKANYLCFQKETSVQEMYAQIVYKDSKIMELNNQILENEKQIMDLQEHIKEKDEVLQQRSRAVQVLFICCLILLGLCLN